MEMPEVIYAVRSWIGREEHFWNNAPFRDAEKYIKASTVEADKRELVEMLEEALKYTRHIRQKMGIVGNVSVAADIGDRIAVLLSKHTTEQKEGK